jgi:hypothetical protein
VEICWEIRIVKGFPRRIQGWFEASYNFRKRIWQQGFGVSDGRSKAVTWGNHGCRLQLDSRRDDEASEASQLCPSICISVEAGTSRVV